MFPKLIFTTGDIQSFVFIEFYFSSKKFETHFSKSRLGKVLFNTSKNDLKKETENKIANH